MSVSLRCLPMMATLGGEGGGRGERGRGRGEVGGVSLSYTACDGYPVFYC